MDVFALHVWAYIILMHMSEYMYVEAHVWGVFLYQSPPFH